MTTHLKKIGSLLALGALAVSAHAAAFTPGNIVVTQYGDGSAALSSAATPVLVQEYLPSTANQGSTVQSIAVPTTGVGSRLTVVGNSGAEGYLARSTDGTILTMGGYDSDAGTTGLAATTATTVNRIVGKLDSNGNFTRTASGSTVAFSGSNIRSAVSDGVNYWEAGTASSSGTGGGVWYSAGGATPTRIGNGNGSGNVRVTKIFNGNLYVSTGSGTLGIWAYTGIPTSSATAVNIINTTSSSPYDFAINPAGTVAYVTDSNPLTSGGGIQKWTFNGSTWSRQFTFGSANGLTIGCLGVTVDFSGPNPVIYAATAETSANKLIKITDTSSFAATSDTTDQATILATAPANTDFHGVAFAPTTIPVMITQPSDSLNNLTNTTFSLSVSTTTGGQTLSYQWYSPDLAHPLTDGSFNGGTISGANTATLQLSPGSSTAQSGNYQVVITNLSGSVTSRVAQVTVIFQPVPPTIDSNISPIGSTNFVGEGVTFSVTAHGVPDVAYQWKWIPDTNTAVTNIISGATSASLPLVNLTTNLSGKYFVTITNSTGYKSTNSALATLKINPTPVYNIATLRGMVDPTTFAPTNTTGLFTTTGIVTTHTNMSTGGCEFYIQDDSGGICIYWSGAAVSSLPPFGAQVRVTGQLAAFHNLLELEAFTSNPLESVIVTGLTQQPVAQPLPFDPNITGSLATMQKLEGNYFVASNVMLAAGATFASISNGESITNNVNKVAAYSTTATTINFTNATGQTIIFYVNGYTDIPGQGKPAGPVTIYGVLGNFGNLFEFTPSRYADIISYVHVTNVLTHARKGDLATNSYTELVLRPGETLNTHVSIADASGGVVTLTQLPAGLSANSSWSNLADGVTATADFNFTPTSADAGSNYLVNLGVTSTAGTSYTETFSVYVPTPDEQQIAITEILANPTTNASATGFFDPLNRGESYSAGISTNDQYIEIANQSGTDFNGGGGALFTLDAGNSASPVFSSLSGSGSDLPPGGSLIVYGGGSLTPNSLNSASAVLSLPTSGTGVLVLRNGANGLHNPGYIIDRVVYAASDLVTNGSLKRFPTIKDGFVPQAYVGFNPVKPGYQYDGANWSSPSQIPASVTNIAVSVANHQAVLAFPVTGTSQAYTLWSAGTVNSGFKILTGKPFSGSSASFSVTNLPAIQFYYISTQTNGTPPVLGGT